MWYIGHQTSFNLGTSCCFECFSRNENNRWKMCQKEYFIGGNNALTSHIQNVCTCWKISIPLLNPCTRSPTEFDSFRGYWRNTRFVIINNWTDYNWLSNNLTFDQSGENNTNIELYEALYNSSTEMLILLSCLLWTL